MASFHLLKWKVGHFFFFLAFFLMRFSLDYMLHLRRSVKKKKQLENIYNCFCSFSQPIIYSCDFHVHLHYQPAWLILRSLVVRLEVTGALNTQAGVTADVCSARLRHKSLCRISHQSQLKAGTSVRGIHCDDEGHHLTSLNLPSQVVVFGIITRITCVWGVKMSVTNVHPMSFFSLGLNIKCGVPIMWLLAYRFSEYFRFICIVEDVKISVEVDHSDLILF